MRSALWLIVIIVLTLSPAQAAGSTVRDFNAAYTASQAAVAKNDHVAAINHTEEALRIHKELFGPQTRDGAALSLNLTRLYGATERWTNAVLAAEEGVRIVEAIGGANDPALAPLLYELGNAHVESDQFDEAVEELERALSTGKEISQEMLGDTHFALAKAYGGRGNMFAMRQQASAAKRAYEKAFGPDSYQVGMALVQLGVAAQQEKKYPRALRYYEDAQEIFNQTLSPEHPLVRSLLGNMTKLAAVAGKSKSALTYAEQLNAANQGEDRARLIKAVAPEYPQSAARKGTEGWVMLEFTITTEGNTQNVRVVESEPVGTFDKSALKSVKKWKFAPKLTDGVPVERHGYQQLIYYELRD